MPQSKSLNIVHLVPTTLLSVGGTVRAALDICSVIARRGHKVTWITADSTDAPEEWKKKDSNCPEIVNIDPLLTGSRLNSQSKLVCERCIKDADVVHIHALWSPCNAQIAEIAKRNNVPWVVSVHGVLDDWSMAQKGLKKRIYLATIIRSMLRGASTILTTAEEELRQASKWLPHDRISSIPCIVDLEPYKEIPSPQAAIDKFGLAEEPTILFLSRVHPKKSIETLIEATSILKKRGTEIRVLIAGTGDDHYKQKMEQLAKKLHVSEQVEFLGLVVGDLKLSLYALADIFALPTRQENFGLVYPEAMLCGTAILTTKGTDIWRELEQGGSTIVERTPESFADGLAKMLSDKKGLQDVGLRGREFIQEWLNPDKIAKEYEDCYENASPVIIC